MAEPVDVRARAVFQEADRDGNGHLSKREIKRVMQKNKELKQELLGDMGWHDLWQVLDADQSKTIELEELVNYMSKRATNNAMHKMQHPQSVHGTAHHRAKVPLTQNQNELEGAVISAQSATTTTTTTAGKGRSNANTGNAAVLHSKTHRPQDPQAMLDVLHAGQPVLMTPEQRGRSNYLSDESGFLSSHEHTPTGGGSRSPQEQEEARHFKGTASTAATTTAAQGEEQVDVEDVSLEVQDETPPLNTSPINLQAQQASRKMQYFDIDDMGASGAFSSAAPFRRRDDQDEHLIDTREVSSVASHGSSEFINFELDDSELDMYEGEGADTRSRHPHIRRRHRGRRHRDRRKPRTRPVPLLTRVLGFLAALFVLGLHVAILGATAVIGALTGTLHRTELEDEEDAQQEEQAMEVARAMTTTSSATLTTRLVTEHPPQQQHQQHQQHQQQRQQQQQHQQHQQQQRQGQRGLFAKIAIARDNWVLAAKDALLSLIDTLSTAIMRAAHVTPNAAVRHAKQRVRSIKASARSTVANIFRKTEDRVKRMAGAVVGFLCLCVAVYAGILLSIGATVLNITRTLLRGGQRATA